MLFNKKAYYNYINLIEGMNIVKLVMILTGTSAIGGGIATYYKQNTYIGIAIGFIIGIILIIKKYYKTRIKVEEMKMKLDIYTKIVETNSNIEK